MRLFCIRDSHALQPQYVNSCVKKGHIYTMLDHRPPGTTILVDGRTVVWPNGFYSLIEIGPEVGHDTLLFVPVEEDQIDETVYERDTIREIRL